MPSSRVQLSHEMLLTAIGDRWSPGEVSTAAELLAGGDGQFPSGIRSLPPDLVSAIQRERLLAAALRATAELGYREMSVQDVLDRSGVSRPTFYEHFENKEACFLAAFDVVRDHLEDLISTAAAAQTEWPQQVIAALRACLEFFAAQPDLARFFLLEAVAATPATANRFREAVLACDPALAAGRAELADPDSLLPGTESSIVGGVVSLASHRIVAGETERLTELLPDMVDFTLSPYLGAERAAELAAASAAS